MSKTGDTSDTDDDVQFQEYSQPLFTENQDVFPSAINSTGGNDGSGFAEYGSDSTDNESQSLINSTIITKKRKYDPEVTITEKNKETCEFQNDYGNHSNQKRNKGEESRENVTDDDNQCIHCFFDKELDKRNYYFGNLLIGELQFLPPCMRSHAYINILSYVEKLKHKHLNNN